MAGSRTGYSGLQIALHWLIAVLIVIAYFTGDDMDDALRARIQSGATGIEGNTLHVWIGGTIFTLVLIRIVVRLASGAPGPVAGTSPALAAAAVWGHRLLYVLMVAAPALGATTWYLGIRDLGEVHELAANALMLVALGHAVAALWHQYVLKDGTLTRMTRKALPGTDG